MLVDVHMPGGGGLSVVANVLQTNPDIHFLALSVSDAIERVAGGDAVFSPKLAGFVLDAFSDTVPVETDLELDRLTPREREVLRQIARGYA